MHYAHLEMNFISNITVLKYPKRNETILDAVQMLLLCFTERGSRMRIGGIIFINEI